MMVGEPGREAIWGRHHIQPAAAARSAVEAAGDLVGFHATDPVSVYLQAWARVRDFETGDLDEALYEERSLLKILGMRRTMFVVPVGLAAVIQSACTETIAKGERSRLVRMIQEAGIAPNGARWLAKVEDQTVEALERRGEATASDLAKDVEGLRTQIEFGTGRKWQGKVGVSTRLLFLLAAEGRIIRGRPRGTLVSSLYRWTPIERWVPGGLARLPKPEAQAELLRHYLAAYGPATLVDIRWWTGWTASEARAALAAIAALEVEIAGRGKAWTLPGDAAVVAAARAAGSRPWVALLPALDATVMGWQERGWFLGSHAKALFDRNGNAGPTVWVDGRVVGGWAQLADALDQVELLEPVDAPTRRRIDTERERLAAWLGDVRFRTRFPSPVERALLARS